jgi:peptide/nickel transport system permease protein
MSVDSSLVGAGATAPAARPVGWVDRAWAFARAKPLGAAGALIILAMLLVAALAQPLAPYDPYLPDYAAQFSRPSVDHWLGTDEFGRDVLSRIIWGSRVSLLVAGVAVLIAMLLGGLLGIIAGFVAGMFDTVSMRFVDVIFAIPALMIALGVVGLIGPSATSVMVALGVAYAPLFARVARSAVIGVRSQNFIEAARAMGASSGRIVREDVFPNVLPLLMVQVTASLAWGVLDEAALGFLGLGVQPPTASWGALLTTGRQYFYQAPTLPVFAGFAVLLVVFAFNLFGDGLRDLLDPRAWSRGE